MFIETARVYPFRTALQVEVMLPHVGLTLVPATVQWVTATGMGVQFGLIGVRETRALMDLTARSSIPDL